MTETGENPIRIYIDNAYGDVLQLEAEIFLKVGAKPKIVTIFNKIKETIININQSSYNFYVNFNIIKVLNNKKPPLNLPFYMHDVIIHFMNMINENNTYSPEVYLDKALLLKNF